MPWQVRTVTPRESAPPSLFQANGHRRPKHREALVEANDLLFVQPEQSAIQELARIADPAPELQVRFVPRPATRSYVRGERYVGAATVLIASQRLSDC